MVKEKSIFPNFFKFCKKKSLLLGMAESFYGSFSLPGQA